MAIPTTSSFDLPVDEIIDAAFARAGGVQQTASELRQARRALNLVFQEITNRGTPLWQMDLYTLPIVQYQIAYTLPADTVDVWKDAVIADTADTVVQDLPVERISYDTYLMLTDKNTRSLPTQFMLERGLAAPTLRLYPAPELTTYVLKFWRIKKPRDASGNLDQVDYPARWQGALVSGLAYYLGMERPDRVNAEMRQELRAKWEQDYAIAAAEYVDRADLTLDVDLTAYTRLWN